MLESALHLASVCSLSISQRGELALDTLIADPALLGPSYANNGKEVITVENCLLHNAGYPPDPNPMYWSAQFACPATAHAPVSEVFTCVDQAYQGLMKQTLINPPGAKFLYSDLSMITLQYVVGKLAHDLGYIKPAQLHASCANAPAGSGLAHSCYYEAYARVYVFQANDMQNTGFLPDKRTWAGVPPTWQDDYYRMFQPQGQVSDENSYALGGIAGHAGVFSNVYDLMKLMRALVFAPQSSDSFLNATTVRLFTTVHNVSQSSRALGWDTNNYAANTYRGCSQLSSSTFTHTGYTGTQICADPERQLITILLTNRCYPVKAAQMDTIHVVRQQWNDAVLAVYNSMSPANATGI